MGWRKRQKTKNYEYESYHKKIEKEENEEEEEGGEEEEEEDEEEVSLSLGVFRNAF